MRTRILTPSRLEEHIDELTRVRRALSLQCGVVDLIPISILDKEPAPVDHYRPVQWDDSNPGNEGDGDPGVSWRDLPPLI